MKIHPEVLRAMDAVHLPEVQEMMQRLAAHGLAIAVPHMHDDEGEFIPLPKGKVGLEADLTVTFTDIDDPAVASSTVVMWRWDGEMKASSTCYGCYKKDRHRKRPCLVNSTTDEHVANETALIESK